MLRWLYKFVFKLLGWKIIGDLPDLKKYIIIVVPHTSNWDFVLGVVVRRILNPRIRFLGKNSLFKPPYGWIFKWLGGYPVDRQKSSAMVETVVNIFDKEESFILALAPEGTRSKVPRWRTGFYHMAVQAKVPIVMVGFDFRSKQVVVHSPFYPSGDLTKDLTYIQDQFKGIKGKNR